jgi:D-3-phosphoglycerate dehydrogenase
MQVKKAIYYNMSGNLDYEMQLLKEWDINDLQLVQIEGSDIINDVKDADALTLEYTTVTDDMLKSLKKLKIIALQSIGFNEIDVNAADKEGIYVTNAPGFCSYEVASHVMALLLNINRKISFYNSEVKNHIWDPFAGNQMQRLKDKICGLVSFGAIPQTLVPMLKGFGIEVVFFDPAKTDEDAKNLGVKRCKTLDELLSISDIVSLHTPLFPSTRGMIDEEQFSLMKDNSIFINCSRGELVNEEALIKNLQNKKIAAAGLDVLCNEADHNSILINMDNVVVTPHVGFLSEDSLKDSRRISLEQIVSRLSKNKKPEFAVNRNIQNIKEL